MFQAIFHTYFSSWATFLIVQGPSHPVGTMPQLSPFITFEGFPNMLMLYLCGSLKLEKTFFLLFFLSEGGEITTLIEEILKQNKIWIVSDFIWHLDGGDTNKIMKFGKN